MSGNSCLFPLDVAVVDEDIFIIVFVLVVVVVSNLAFYFCLFSYFSF